MADSKKYYWIKLKTDFFNQKEVKKLRKIAGGDTYTIIYLKLQLLSAKADGVIKYDGTEKDLIEQLELELDEDRDNISITLSFLQANQLIEQINNTDYLLNKACDSIGKEGTSAERVRRHREQKALQCNTIETKRNTEKEKEKEKETDIEKREEKEYILEKDFSLTKLTSYDNVSDKYKEKLEEFLTKYIDDLELKIMKVNSKKKTLQYDDFILALSAKGYKYKNFISAYKTWNRKA